MTETESPSMLTYEILKFISARAKDKLDAKVKALVKAQDAGDGAGIEKAEQDLAQENEKYEPRTWLTNAAIRAKQISFVSHALKYTHSDAKGSSLFVQPDETWVEGWPEGSLISHNSLADMKIDVVGNAAALDVAKLLNLQSGSKTLFDYVTADNTEPFDPIADDPQQAEEWVQGLKMVLQADAPSSHTLAKQIYFPVQEDYHLLGPLFNSSLTASVQSRLSQYQFSEQAKAAREQRTKSKYSEHHVVNFPDAAVQTFGGTKPQNISQLNSERGGKVQLFSSAPPQWQTQHSPPLKTTSLITGPFSYKVRGLTYKFADFLKKVAKRSSTMSIRGIREHYLKTLIDELLQYSYQVQQFRYSQPGWTLSDQCLLPRHQQLWLDPGRCQQDPDFKQARESLDWIDEVAKDFGRWLNDRLMNKSENLVFETAEHDYWKKSLANELRLFKQGLEQE